MAELQAHGLSVDAPRGWEGRIFRRAAHGEVASAEIAGAAAPDGESTFPVVHVATISLPMDVADYGSDVVDELRRDDALVILKEFDPADAGEKLFRRAGMPRRLRVADFSLGTLQRRLDGQAGYQAFFHEEGRAFCLYVVLGDYDRRTVVVPRVNRILATVTIDPLVAPEPTTLEPTTTVPTEPTTTVPTEPTTTVPTEPTTTVPTEPTTTVPTDPPTTEAP